jgi:DivIVA domain-containing protein
LTPYDIETHEFLVSLRGYDRDEVHEFLAQIAGQIRDLQGEIEQLNDAPAPQAAPEEVPAEGQFGDLGRTTQRIIEAAEQAGEEIKRDAREAAGQELAEARALAREVVAEGHFRRSTVDGCVEQLEGRRGELVQDLDTLANIVEDMLATLAQPGTGPTPSELREITAITAPDRNWRPAAVEAAARS